MITTIKNYPSILLFLANEIWGGNFVVGGIAKDYFHLFSLSLSLLRWVIAMIIMTPFIYTALL